MSRRKTTDPYGHDPHDYNVGLVVSELERRFILYLIGGDYEKMFYSLTGDERQDEFGNTDQSLGRIRLEVEISESERRSKFRDSVTDPDYKGMLDLILSQRLKSFLVSGEELVNSVPEIVDILPFLRLSPKDNKIDEALCKEVCQVSWLVEQLKAFCANPKVQQAFGQPAELSIKERLMSLDFPHLIWLIPILMAQEIQGRIHPSLLETYKKIRFYGRVMGGAIGLLVQEHSHFGVAKWKLYALGALNCVAITVLLCIVSDGVKELISQQKLNLKDREAHKDKFEVLDHYHFNQDFLRDILQLEDIVKPSILDSIQIAGLDPSEYISGYNDATHPECLVFQQARAYAFYRQLYRTGRIQKYEAGIFLRRYNLSKNQFNKLNRLELASLPNHIQIFADLLQS